MRNSQLGLLIFILVIFSSCYRPVARQAFEDLKILEGKWFSTEGPQFNEQWKVVNDSLMIGVGFSMNEGDTAFKEQLKIYRSGDQVFYGAQVGENNNFIYFKLKEARIRSWMFENPVHDYPNIIQYKLIDEHTLVAKTTNMRGNKEVIFKMKKSEE